MASIDPAKNRDTVKAILIVGLAAIFESFMKHESNFIEVLTIIFNPYYGCFLVFDREFFLN